jgi:hypothetical protein
MSDYPYDTVAEIVQITWILQFEHETTEFKYETIIIIIQLMFPPGWVMLQQSLVPNVFCCVWYVFCHLASVIVVRFLFPRMHDLVIQA